MTLAEEKKFETLLNEYEEAVKRPATVTYDFRKDPSLLESPSSLDENNVRPISLLTDNSSAKRKGMEDAFVLPNLLTVKECQDLIDSAEANGIHAPAKANGTPRTAKRTSQYQHEALSTLVAERIAPILAKQFAKPKDSTLWFGDFHAVHSNWRIVRYDPGDAFPAHQDQMDSLQILDKQTGKKDYLVSTHTLLIHLTPAHQDLKTGGATRFYPRAKLGAHDTVGQYDEAVDVWLPQGWALAFPQHGLVHAGQPVLASSEGASSVSKYIAQAGLMRKLPPGKLCPPSVFKLGPGIPRP